MRFSTEEINKRIKYVVSLSKEIPWYAKKYKELKINPDEIKNPDDLLKAYEKGMYTSKVDLPNLATNYKIFRQLFITSGTTGKPAIIEFTPDDIKRDQRQCFMGYSVFLSENDRILNCFPSPPVISGEASVLGLTSLPVRVFHVPAQTLRDADTFLEYRNILDFNVVFGLTTSIYRLPIKLAEKGVTSHSLGIEKILTSGEPSSVERRKKISEEFGSAEVFDWYASTENLVIGFEERSFSNEYKVTIPETLLFIVKDCAGVEEGEKGDVLITNLYNIGEKPGVILLNYRIGDSAKLVKKEEGIVTYISEITRESAYLAGAKLNPVEVEKVIENLNTKEECLTGEYLLVNYHDPKTRKAVLEIRIEVLPKISNEKRENIAQKLLEEIYSANIEVSTAVKDMADAEISVKTVESGELYQGFEHLLKPGKPKRLITIS
ncbi:MAG: AMP-binding protein [Nitrososphaerota archaeon]